MTEAILPDRPAERHKTRRVNHWLGAAYGVVGKRLWQSRSFERSRYAASKRPTPMSTRNPEASAFSWEES